MVSIEDVRAFATTLPRAQEVLVRDRVKFRVGRLVFAAFFGPKKPQPRQGLEQTAAR